MQSKFTEPAKEALNAASRYASNLKQGYVGTEHILAGLLKEQTGVAHRVLADNGVELTKVLDMIRESIAFEGGVSIREKDIPPAHRQYWRKRTDRRLVLDRKKQVQSIS